MKRKLKLTLSIDYNKLMKKNKVEIVKEGYCSSQEELVISTLVNKLAMDNKLIKEVDSTIEDLETWKSKGFRKSNKMGSSCSRGWRFK